MRVAVLTRVVVQIRPRLERLMHEQFVTAPVRDIVDDEDGDEFLVGRHVAQHFVQMH